MPFMFAAESSSGGGGVLTYFPLLLLALVFALMVFSQRKRAKATSQAQESLRIGDEVRTTSGLYGTLTHLDAQAASIEIAEGVVVRFDRRAVTPAPDAAGEATASERNEGASPVEGGEVR